ncbi:MAG TPA: biotin--[acetyl-CoA-carboxylase] ligase, partial [Bacillota bacterium]|nr:biotin--[acetyl-CoA-carboxylase] ligase [Bacillota bacterium]
AKGRLNRPWQSPKGTGIWLSMILRPEMMPNKAPQLTLLMATVLADVIYEITGVKPQIKWPNDLLIDGKKIAGILTEMQAEQDQIQYIVIAFGLNVNQDVEDIDPSLRDRATSIRIATSQTWDRQQMIQQILHTFETTYELYLREGFSKIKEKWESYGFKVGQKIQIKQQDQLSEATFIGISHDGALIVQMENGDKEELYSAEINWFKHV